MLAVISAVALALLFLVLGILGAFAAAGLLLYSPTKLSKRVTDRNNPAEGEALVDLLDRQHEELLAAGRLLVPAGAAGAVYFASQVGSGGYQITWLVSIWAAVLFGIGVLPVAAAQRRAEAIVLATLPFLKLIRALFLYPLIRPLLAITKPILRAFKVPDQPPTDTDQIADEILAAVADSASENDIQVEGKEWIGNIVALRDLHAYEVMTPRIDIVAMDARTPLREAVRMAVDVGHSRFPVYQEKVDNVVGVFYAKDALSHFAGNGSDMGAETPVGEIARKPLFAPESMAILDLLREIKTSKVQLAVILDEYGGTSGIVTLEDILEEIVGDIADEYDIEEEEPITILEANRVIEVSGKTRVDEANEVLQDRIPAGDDYETVAGFVFNHLGQIPRPGERFAADGIEYTVLRADERRIDRLRLELLPSGTSAD